MDYETAQVVKVRAGAFLIGGLQGLLEAYDLAPTSLGEAYVVERVRQLKADYDAQVAEADAVFAALAAEPIEF